MKFVRRISTSRLLTLCAAVIAIAIGTTAMAMATAGAGPKPAPESLPVAVHDALTAPSVAGISARVQFTNHLVDASSIEGQGSDPFINGASGRLWASPEGGGKLRLELQSEGGGGDSQVLVDEGRFEIYDGGSGTAYRGTLPKGTEETGGPDSHQPPSLEQIQQAIAHLGDHVTLSGASPSDVAGQPTYTVRAEPKSNGGLLGGIELAWDAAHGTPLRAAVYARGDSSPVLQLEATEASFESIPSSVFEISPPPGTKVVNVSTAGAHPSPGGEESNTTVTTQGHDLETIVIVKSPAKPGGSEPGGSEPGGLSLPTVSINGAKAEVLETALGTVVRFSRGGDDYVVAGSAPAATVEAAARGI
jgi:outer membrane lipoprotein-sorting protein